MIYVSAFSLILIISPFSSALVNYTFNRNLIPHDMKEFQQQTRDFTFTNPLTPAELKSMLANTESVIPNFEMDSINDTAHRFETLHAVYEKKKNTFVMKPKKNILRNEEREESGNLLRQSNDNAVKRAIDLMTQFVYAARYKLTYGQQLRANYKSTLEYKIGYCFALMRDIRQQQLQLYSTMYFNHRLHVRDIYRTEDEKNKEKNQPHSYLDLVQYFTIYEKVVKLDVDMKDVVALTQKLMDMRWLAPNSTSTTNSSSSSDNPGSSREL